MYSHDTLWITKLCDWYSKQEVTRSHKGWALDTVVLHNEVTKFFKDSITAPPIEGVYVHGLMLDGAGWDRSSCRLVEAKPKLLSEPLPVILMDAVNSSGAESPEGVPAASVTRSYECPIYKKPKRTLLTYIASVRLKTREPVDHWAMRGVALLCDTK